MVAGQLPFRFRLPVSHLKSAVNSMIYVMELVDLSSKRECDNDFYRCMSCSCQEEYSGFVTEDSCLAAACSYHQAVHDYGCDAFSIAQSQSCLCPNSTKSLRYSKESGDEAHIPMNKFGIFPIAHKVDGLCDPPFEADCGSVPENSLFGLFATRRAREPVTESGAYDATSWGVASPPRQRRPRGT